MKIHIKKLFIALVLLSILDIPFSNAHAQGALTPPGAPGPTMKSLDQIYTQIGAVSDQRIAVNAMNTPGSALTALYIISQPGSYYLTTNIVGVSGEDGIDITANNVTLDLNGFSIQGGANSAGSTGIYIVNAQTNITVRNGAVSGWAIGAGTGSANAANIVFEHLDVSDGGFYGIYLTGAGIVRDCNSHNNASSGIECDNGGVVSGCTCNNNYGDGIYVYSGIVSGCTAKNNDAPGIVVNAGTVSGCVVWGNQQDGIDGASSTISGCTVEESGQSGIVTTAPGSAVIGNTCIGNNTSLNSSCGGIFINNSNCRVEDNHVSGSGYAGIYVNGGYTNNIIIKNSVSGNGAHNYITPGNQVVGPLITTTGTITSTSPWANFSF